MKYRLRTLLILSAAGPIVLAAGQFYTRALVARYLTAETRRMEFKAANESFLGTTWTARPRIVCGTWLSGELAASRQPADSSAALNNTTAENRLMKP